MVALLIIRRISFLRTVTFSKPILGEMRLSSSLTKRFSVATPLICEAWMVSVEVQDEYHEYQTALSYS